jgi:hypothetical protein
MRRAWLVGALGLLASARRYAQPSEEAAMGRRVQDLLHAHQADIYGCVRAAAVAPTGEMLVRVLVGDAQRAERADVLKDQSGSGALGVCITDKIKQWDLTSLGADPGDQVVFPLMFKPDEVKRGEQRAKGKR